MANYHLHLKAYARKKELGGGFAGKVTEPRQPGSEPKVHKEVFETYEKARDWTISKADELMRQRRLQHYRRCSVNRGSSGTLYEAFIYA
jgi:hypothetical protein